MKKCLICGHRFTPIQQIVAKESYYYLICSFCTGGILMPRQRALKNLKNAYTREYFDWKEAVGFRKNLNKLQIFTPYPKWIEKTYFKKGKKILDVGAGIPDFALKMQKKGWNSFALEISKEQVQLIEKFLGKKHVWQGDFEKRYIPPKSFDVITFWHMLEHLNNPFKAMRKGAEILTENGMIFAEFPNLDSFNLKLFGKNYCYFDLPGHLVYYNRKSLLKLFTKNGFTDIKISYPMKLNSSFSINLSSLVTKKIKNKSIGQTIFYLTLPISILLSLFNSFCGKTDLMRISAAKN